MHVTETFNKRLNGQLGATRMLNAVRLENAHGDGDGGFPWTTREQAFTHQRWCYTIFCGLELHINGGRFLKTPSAAESLSEKGHTEHIYHPNLVNLLHSHLLLLR
jgi:hypothetical protein